MVLYYFPPLGGVAVSRNVRAVQYLPASGWDPLVLTVRDPAEGPPDPATLRLVADDVTVARTGSVEAGHIRGIAARILGPMLRRLGSSAVEASPADGASSAGSDVLGPTGLSGLRRMVFFPDDQVGWLPFAVSQALRLRRSPSFDLIFSTSSPVSAHLIAGTLKRLTGRPWVAEFRDPWLGNALAGRLPWFHRRLQLRIERWIVRSADRIVCVTPSLAAMYRRRYPWATVVTITNGYDRSEAIVAGGRAPGAPFRIVWTGSLYRPDELRVFLDGVGRLLDRRRDLRGAFEVIFYGLVSPACREVLDQALSDGGLDGVVSMPGFVPRSTALQAVADADAALLLLGNGPGMALFATGKLFDYLGQGRQIFAMAPQGDARDILSGLDWGVVVDPEAASVADGLEHLLVTPPPEGRPDPEGKYDRVNLVGRLAAVFDEAVERRQREERVRGVHERPESR